MHYLLGQNAYVFSCWYDKTKNYIQPAAKPRRGISPYEPMLNCTDEDIGDKSLPVWMRTILCFLLGKKQFLNLHQSQSESKMKQNRTQRLSGSVTKLCFIVIGKQDLGGITYRDVIKHPVMHLTDWKHITRTDRAGENVHV